MRSAAAAAFYPEMLQLEASLGPINWIYPDSRLLPTTGIGSLLGSTKALNAAGLALPWRFPSGEYATEAQIANEWDHLRSLGVIGSGYAYQDHASLFLDQDVVQWDFDHRAKSLEAAVSGYLPNWAQMFADAQLAAMSMAWNVGQHMFDPTDPDNYWPSLTAQLKAQDYLAAAENCRINGKPSARNRRNRILFTQAARAKQFKADPETLYGPDATISAAALAATRPTETNATGWWVQRMLGLLGFYKGPLDALFGPMSKAALAAYGKSRGVTGLGVLRRLSDETLQVTVTA